MNLLLKNSLPSTMLFACRVVSVDSYRAPLYEKYDIPVDYIQHPNELHPVIRIFGVTPGGQKCVCHVHGVYPYFYVAAVASDVARDSEKYCEQFKLDLQHALGRPGVIQCVRAVRGASLYGFHHNPDASGDATTTQRPEVSQVFLQIFLRDPGLIKNAAGVLQLKGYQPFESHIPYLLQFYIDYAIHGMSLLKASDVRFRSPLLRSSLSSVLRGVPLSQATLTSRVGLTPIGIDSQIDVRGDVTSCLQATPADFKRVWKVDPKAPPENEHVSHHRNTKDI